MAFIQLQEGDYELIKALVETVSYLSSLSDEKAASIKQLLIMLFGSKTEKAEMKNTDALPKPGNPKKRKKGHGKNSCVHYFIGWVSRCRMITGNGSSGNTEPGALRRV